MFYTAEHVFTHRQVGIIGEKGMLNTTSSAVREKSLVMILKVVIRLLGS